MSRKGFTAVRTEGGLLPRELLERIAAEDSELPGIRKEEYHLAPTERLGEAVSRSWNRLVGLWEGYTEVLAKLPEGDPATGLTRDRWLLPLFAELGYGRLQRSPAVTIEGKSFAISHGWQRTPIHLVGAGVDIDRRTPGVAGAAAAAPHGLVQEFLNRSDEHLWALVSNGRLLRILRDNHSLSRQAYIEFDLEAIMEDGLFSDFRLLWLVCHQSRVEAERPEDSWLEGWFQHSREEGVRALDALRDGVEAAIVALGAGFLRHPANTALHEALRTGELDKQEYYRELLRLVYRLIFLFVAEDRDALLDPAADPAARRRYTAYYASTRLRDLAGRRRGTPHDDLWRGLRLVLSRLHDGAPELALPALGSYLWSEEAVAWTGSAELRNDDLLAALRALCYTTHDTQLLPVNWRTMGSEELGSVYEGLLELHPEMNREAGSFELKTAAGHERKTTGSYYTPTALVDRLLESALEPVLEEAMRAEDPAAALLDLRVIDTAAGSGHFLVAAARRIAMRLASVRTGDEEASPAAVRGALRDVVGRCIYGVDLNPLAVELCKVSLWMEALEPGKPLSFLDHHIQVGNSLLGTTPHLLGQGIPNDAFKPIEGDDRATVTRLRTRNRQERASEQTGFHLQLVAEPGARYHSLEDQAAALERADDSTLAALREKEARYHRLIDSPEYRAQRLVADAWCAAFVWRKTEDAPPPITEELFRQIQQDPAAVPAATVMEIRRLAEEYRFFHFHVAFPDVFRTGEGRAGGRGGAAGEGGEGDGGMGWDGGFDVVLGNPPWERIKLQEKEWFAGRAPEIAEAPNAARRRKLIAALETEDPELFQAFADARRHAEAQSHLVRNSGRYPLCGRGDINTYSIFSEGNRSILAPRGRLGIIVPSGIATDATTQFFFRDLMETESLVSLYDFENREAIFPGVHRSYKFCLLTIAGSGHEHDAGAEFAFFLHSPKELDDPERRFLLTGEDIALLNPNTRTCPIFRTRRDAEITKGIYRRVPVLVREDDPEGNPWGVSFLRMFDMSNDSHLFRTREELEGEGWTLEGNVFVRGAERYLPLYEAKMIHQFDHRWATYEGADSRDVTETEKETPDFEPLPRYWVSSREVEGRLPDGWNVRWLFGFRDITNVTNERTVISSLLPVAGVGHTMPLIIPGEAQHALLLAAQLNSFVLDYVARQKLGGTHLTYTYLRQLPCLDPAVLAANAPWDPRTTLSDWLSKRVIELQMTSKTMHDSIDESGLLAGPSSWTANQRLLLRAELDAALFQLYGVDRDDLTFIMDTFPIVQRNEEREFGEYRTKRIILEIYDEMTDAMRRGKC